jgi:hypothetical protein
MSVPASGIMPLNCILTDIERGVSDIGYIYLSENRRRDIERVKSIVFAKGVIFPLTLDGLTAIYLSTLHNIII